MRYFPALLLLVSGPALAEDQALPVGSEAQSFTLRTINPEATDKRLVSIDDSFSPGESKAQAVLLSFFATYCKPCKRELPFLEALWQSYRAKGLQVYVISIDREQEKIDELKTLATELGLTFPVLWDRFNIVAKRYAISKLPCVYLIGADRRIQMVNVGYNDDVSPQLLKSVRQGLGVPQDAPIEELLKKHVNEAALASGAAPATPAASGGDATSEAPSPAPADAAPAAADFNETQQLLVAFAQEWLAVLDGKCDKPPKCLKAFTDLGKGPSKKATAALGKLKKKKELTDALTARLKELRDQRDGRIEAIPELAKNKKLKALVKKLDKAVGL